LFIIIVVVVVVVVVIIIIIVDLATEIEFEVKNRLWYFGI